MNVPQELPTVHNRVLILMVVSIVRVTMIPMYCLRTMLLVLVSVFIMTLLGEVHGTLTYNNEFQGLILKQST